MGARFALAVCAAAATAAAAAQDGPPQLAPGKPRVALGELKLRSPGEYRLRELRRTLDPRAEERRAALAANPLLQGRPYRSHIAAAARRYDLDPALLHALITAESNYRADAVSPAGAIGLMQIMPETAVRYGVRTDELYRPESNLRAGTRYLVDLLRLFSGDLELALAGYNAGEGAVIRHGGRIPPFGATRAYVPKVLQLYERLRHRAEAEPVLAESALPHSPKL